MPAPSTDKEIRSISSWSVKRPVATLSITAAILVLGVLFSGRLPLSLLPEVDYPHIRVVVNYPGVTPEVIEEQVTRVLERNLSATENLVEIHGRASEGRSYIEMFFEVGVDTDKALQDAARQLERARAALPPGVDPPRIMKMDPSQQPIFELAFSSPLVSSIELRQWIDQRLVPQLLTIPGTGTIEVAGGREREIDVVIDPELMRSYGLDMITISNILAEQNIDLASGNITSGEYDVLARTENRFRDARHVGNTIIPLNNGAHYIRLSEVATVSDSHREQRLFARHNGQDAVQVSIMKQPDANTVEVTDGLRNLLNDLAATGYIPDGISWDVIRDDSFFIRASLRSVSLAAITGGLLAMLIIYLFLGSAVKSLIIGMTLPVSIIATFLLMTFSGLSLNIMSLGGLALGVGLLIDNGLVVLENIFRTQQSRQISTSMAARQGASEVAPAVLAGTMTNLAAVLPFLLLSGLTSLIFRELILTIAFAMVSALIASLTLVPSLYALTKAGGSNPDKAQKGIPLIQRLMNQLIILYGNMIPGVVRWRYLMITGAVVVLVITILSGRQAGSEFLPPVDDGRITMRFVLPLGTPPEPTRDVAVIIEDIIRSMPHVDSYYSTSGGYFRGGQLSIRAGMIDMVVQLTTPSARRGYAAEQWVRDFRDKISETGLIFTQERLRGPRIEGLRTSMVDDDISVGIIGDDLDVLEDLAREILPLLNRIEGVESARIDRDERIPQLLIQLDDERAADMGITAASAGRFIRSAIEGTVPTKYISGGFEYNIRVRLPRTTTGSMSVLGNIPVADITGRQFNLGSIAHFEEITGPAHIERLNQIRIVRVNAMVDPAMSTIGQVQQRVENIMQEMELPTGYNVVYGGSVQNLEEANRSMRLAIFLAIFFVFIVMAIQYEKITSPLVIISSLPFAAIGALWLLLITGTPFSAPVLLGAIFLVGIIVNNAILLIDFANRQRSNPSIKAAEAVTEAGRVRLRPVLMTTLTTVFGMLPLALKLGEGAELLQPLALTVIGGLLVGTLLTLVLLPGIYVIIDDISKTIKNSLFS